MIAAESRDRQLWDHTSQLLAVIANGLLRGEHTQAFRAEDLHPYGRRRRRERPQVTPEEVKENWGILKRVIVDGR